MNLFDWMSRHFWLVCKSGAMSAFWIKVTAVASLPFFALWLRVASRMNFPIPS